MDGFRYVGSFVQLLHMQVYNFFNSVPVYSPALVDPLPKCCAFKDWYYFYCIYTGNFPLPAGGNGESSAKVQ